MRTVSAQGKAQAANSRLSEEPGQAGSVVALLRTTLRELLAIGLVGLATYFLVCLIVWLASLLGGLP